jgi:transposase
VKKYKRKHARNPDKRMAAAVRLRAQGLSLRQIGEQLACSYQTVARDLNRWQRERPNVVRAGPGGKPH